MLRLRAASSLFVLAALSGCLATNAPPRADGEDRERPAPIDDDQPIDEAPIDDEQPIDDEVPPEQPVPDDEAPAPDADGPRRFTVRLSNVAPWTVLKSGVFNTPVGRSSPGPIRPGDAYEVTFTAGDRHRVSFATMLGASNDWFYGTPPDGIALYADGVPLSGDVTSQIRLYDAGTEIDEEPGVGASTGPRQSEPTQGAPDPIGFVRAVQNPAILADGSSFSLPAVEDVLRVTITPVGERAFRLRIENVCATGALQTSQGPRDIGLSPGIWLVHGQASPLFEIGLPDRGEGLEILAESGRVQALADAFAPRAGVATGFSPGIYVVHDGGAPLFSVGQPDRGQGLEEIAESGDVGILDEALGTAFPEGARVKAVFDTTEGSTEPGPLRPGQTYAFSFVAHPGDRLSFASMFGASNDWIVATPESGVALFDDAGRPLAGDFTGDLRFYDVGTEIDEEPAVGAYTGPNQAGPDDGPADAVGTVRALATTTYAVPVEAHLQLMISVEAL